MSDLPPGLDPADVGRPRICANCETEYSIGELWDSQRHYFPPPHNYSNGCVVNCLTCWLGCGPDPTEPEGHLLKECGDWLSPVIHLAVLPMARVTFDLPIVFPGRAAFYPRGFINLNELNVIPNGADSGSLREFCNAASGVDQGTVEDHSVIVFPVSLNWEKVWKTSYQDNLEIIRLLSEEADRLCLDIVRFRLCRLDLPDALPGRAGQLETNQMMAGALLYNAAKQEARLLGGAAFTHVVTAGLGLPLEPLAPEAFPQQGEVGNIVGRGLALYSDLLEVNNSTAKFIQALALLEFLAIPDGYAPFKKVSAIVRRYLTEDSQENSRLKERLNDLTGRKDPETNGHIGYRTRIVHIGDRLRDLVPDAGGRRELFKELDSYIRPVIDHMIKHSAFDWNEYLDIRDRMGVAGASGLPVNSDSDA